MDANDLPKDIQAMGIAGGAASLFASHPSLEERIAALHSNKPITAGYATSPPATAGLGAFIGSDAGGDGGLELAKRLGDVFGFARHGSLGQPQGTGGNSPVRSIFQSAQLGLGGLGGAGHFIAGLALAAQGSDALGADWAQAWSSATSAASSRVRSVALRLARCLRRKRSSSLKSAQSGQPGQTAGRQRRRA